MAKSTTTCNDVLKALLKGTDPSWRTNANLYLSLHTADPGVGGNQTTSEATYGDYDRVTLVKSGAWTDTGTATFTNAGLLQFPQAASGTNTITYVAIGTVAYNGTGQILYSGQLNTPLNVSTGIQPQFSIGALSVTEA